MTNKLLNKFLQLKIENYWSAMNSAVKVKNKRTKYT